MSVRRAWNHLPLRFKALAVLLVPLIPLIVSAVLVVVTVGRERAAQERVARTLAVKAQAAETLNLAVDAEVGVRGYLLTRRDEWLLPYQASVRGWAEAHRQLLELVADNPAQVASVQRVVAHRDLAPLDELLRYARTHGPEAPAPLDLLTRSRAELVAVRRELAAMQQREDRLLGEHVAAAAVAQGQLLAATLGGASLGLFGGLVAVVLFTANIARRIDRSRVNGERLAVGSELLPFIDAADEVGRLSQSIADAYGLLETRERELRQRVRELRAVNEELEAFTYSVSHDLRAPLRHITGFTALLERTAAHKLDDEERRRLATISGAAVRMGRLIDDLLEFSRKGRLPFSRGRIALAESVREARRELLADADAGATWIVHPLPEVTGDAALLRQVFVNLIGNALKYSRGQADPRIEIGAETRPGEVVIFVRDNGVGFDSQYAHKLFGVFQRLHSQDEFEGTGIGLANVRRIVSRHGGRTWAEGEVGRGATFYFSLPDPPPEPPS